MGDFGERFLESLLDYFDSLDNLTNSNDDFLCEALNVLKERIKIHAVSTISQKFYDGKIKEENADAELAKEELSIYCVLVRESIIYNLLFPTPGSENYVNYMLGRSFIDIVQDIQNDCELSILFLKYYIKFVLGVSKGSIKYEDIIRIKDIHPWLDTLFFSKGYFTINDRCRRILLNMHEALITTGCDKKEVNCKFDEYFRSSESNYFIKNEFPELTSKEDILKLKNYQFRLIISDVYIAIKLWAICEPDEEKERTIEVLENAILNSDGSAICDKQLLHHYYSTFFIYNKNRLTRDADMEILGAHDAIPILKKANPMYFMD